MSTIPAKIAEYFGADGYDAQLDSFYEPGRGWRIASGDVSLDRLRLLAKAGATAVAVTAAGRTADFTIAEVLRFAQRPLLGGRLI